MERRQAFGRRSTLSGRVLGARDVNYRVGHVRSARTSTKRRSEGNLRDEWWKYRGRRTTFHVHGCTMRPSCRRGHIPQDARECRRKSPGLELGECAFEHVHRVDALRTFRYESDYGRCMFVQPVEIHVSLTSISVLIASSSCANGYGSTPDPETERGGIGRGVSRQIHGEKTRRAKDDLLSVLGGHCGHYYKQHHSCNSYHSLDHRRHNPPFVFGAVW